MRQFTALNLRKLSILRILTILSILMNTFHSRHSRHSCKLPGRRACTGNDERPKPRTVPSHQKVRSCLWERFRQVLWKPSQSTPTQLCRLPQEIWRQPHINLRTLAPESLQGTHSCQVPEKVVKSAILSVYNTLRSSVHLWTLLGLSLVRPWYTHGWS